MIAWIGEHEIKAPLTGMVRGLLNDGLAVVGGFKIGDIDPVVKPLISPAFLIKPGRLAAA
ncbi:NAD(P)-binding Rossman fold [Escherichia coli]|nr:NAD(P)-binding Rossman fold [Escherichia coli]